MSRFRVTQRRTEAEGGRRSAVGLIGACLLFAGCGGDDDGTGPGPTVATVSVTAASSTDLDAIGATVQLAASAADAGGAPVAGVSFTWSSSAEGNGATTVAATAGGVAGTADLTVEQVATELTFGQQPPDGSVGDALAPAIELGFLDANGHVAKNNASVVTVALAANPTGATLLGTFAVAAADGVASFPSLSLDTTGVGFALGATGDGLIVVSDPFDVTIFADVPASHPARAPIETAFKAGAMEACGMDPRVFCPDDAMTREVMAAVLLRALEGPTYAPPPATGAFDDVPTSSPYAPWIEEHVNRGLSGGCDASNYCPTAPVNRAQMSLFLLRTLEGSGYSPPAASGVFDDVPTSHAFADWIEDLFTRSDVVACSTVPPLFCPNDAIIRADMALWLTVSLGL
jgi:hypothetical protein